MKPEEIEELSFKIIDKESPPHYFSFDQMICGEFEKIKKRCAKL